ncbi:MAG: LPS assembly lipoprotein LptE [Desulfuromonadaceae bacterium]|nr:LPS assembly lipoprotein LptE [Desulfuromonadaceae bacterium]
MPAFLLWLRFLMLALLLNAVAGCGYHLTGSQSQHLGAAQTIWVPFFSNESISPTAQTVLRRSFYEELHALRGLTPANSQGSADLAMKARIISYSSGVVSYSAIDRATEYSLSLDVELEITKKGDTSPLWKGQIHTTKQYPAGTDLALQRNAEEQALDAAARIIAQKFISALEESY